MKTIIFSFVALLATVSMISCSKSKVDTITTPLSSSDSLFAVKASQSNIAEINAAQVSQTNSQNDSVKMFAQMMIRDHGMAKKSLDSIGKLLNFNMPATADSAHIAFNMMLMNLHGSDFDSVYVNDQVADHQSVLALLGNEMNNGSNASLKAYAAKNYPIVQMHLLMADSLKAEMKH